MHSRDDNPYQSPVASQDESLLVRNPDGSLEVAVNIVEQDIVAFHKHFWMHSPAHRRHRAYQWMRTVIVLLGLMLLFVSTEVLTVVAVLPVTIAVLYFIVRPHLVQRRLQQSVTQFLHQGRNYGVVGDQRIIVTPTEVAKYHTFGHSAHQWPGVDRIDIDDEHIFVFVSVASAIIIPLRDLPRPTDRVELKETVLRYFNEAEKDRMSN